jgi:hypothetical protein
MGMMVFFVLEQKNKGRWLYRPLYDERDKPKTLIVELDRPCSKNEKLKNFALVRIGNSFRLFQNN